MGDAHRLSFGFLSRDYHGSHRINPNRTVVRVTQNPRSVSLQRGRSECAQNVVS